MKMVRGDNMLVVAIFFTSLFLVIDGFLQFTRIYFFATNIFVM